MSETLKEVIILFFGEEGFLKTTAFIFFTLFGMTWVKIARFNIKKKFLKASDPSIHLEWTWYEWKDDNLLDFILAFMTAFGVFRFFPDTFGFMSLYFDVPKFTDQMAYGLALGLFFQYILHRLMNNLTLEKISDLVLKKKEQDN